LKQSDTPVLLSVQQLQGKVAKSLNITQFVRFLEMLFWTSLQGLWIWDMTFEFITLWGQNLDWILPMMLWIGSDQSFEQTMQRQTVVWWSVKTRHPLLFGFGLCCTCSCSCPCWVGICCYQHGALEGLEIVVILFSGWHLFASVIVVCSDNISRVLKGWHPIMILSWF